MLFMPVLLGLPFDAADHLLCEVAVSVRDLLTEISAVPRRPGAVWLRALALSSRPKLGPAVAS